MIDIWSLQPQPHLQPRATLPRSRPTSGSHQGYEDNGSKGDEPPIVVTTPSAASSHTASDHSAGAVPKHWGEVVINPKRERKGMDAEGGNGRDVFDVLQVS